MDVTKYKVVIAWSEEYQRFIAEVPELPECMADGETQAEALANIHVIAQEWVETAVEVGIPVPLPMAVAA